MDPAWQSSLSEQVPAEALPAAVALNSISYNIARSVGPAVGGMVVATAGAVASFALNALLYLPLLVALFLWKRISGPSYLPPEKLNRAIVSGIRYIANSALNQNWADSFHDHRRDRRCHHRANAAGRP